MSDRSKQEAEMAAIRAPGAEADDHLLYETLAAVVDGSADDVTREIVQSHVAVCESCASELDDLRGFTGGTRRPQRMWWLAAAAAVAAIATGVMTFSSFEPEAERATPRPIPRKTLPAVAAGYGNRDWDQLVAEALRTGRVETPSDLRSFAAADVFRGGGEPAATVRLSPTATVILETQPQFLWSGVSADDYQVRIDADGHAVARSPRLREPTWRCPRELERGRTYRWQVVARRGDEESVLPLPPAPPAVFRVLGSRELSDLTIAARRHPSDDLLLGLLHARAGVLDRARAHLARYASATGAPIATKLLDSLQRNP